MTTEKVPICTERFALERIRIHQNELATELSAAKNQFDEDGNVYDEDLVYHHLNAALDHTAAIKGFLDLAGIK